MTGKTTIEWTGTYDQQGKLLSEGKSWNPVTGCTEVSPGCDHCYARTIAERFRGVPGSAYEQGFDLKLWPDRLELPLRWKKPAKIFVNSMSDLFHKDVPDDYIYKVFETMRMAKQHTFQVLTKRPSRVALMAHRLYWAPNIWIGTSIESNEYIWRADKLRQVPARVRFISAEPLLGELTDLDLDGIHWLIAGSESGHGARLMDDNWVRFLRDLCQQHETRFFFKQRTVKGKKVPTPELDGRTWKEFPEGA
jgi:protein gp37